MKEPVDHILRPRLPWRAESEAAITECGYDASKVKVLTRDEFTARLKEFGSQRAAMFTCMTCSQTAQRWATWDVDPRQALEREITWECGWRGDKRGTRLKDELLAIAAIVQAHQDEFGAIMLEQKQRRDWLKLKAAKS